jgi:hypothetical protein
MALAVSQLDDSAAVQTEVVKWRAKQADLIYCNPRRGWWRRGLCIERQENFRPFLKDWDSREGTLIPAAYFSACIGCNLFFLDKLPRPKKADRIPMNIRGRRLTPLGLERVKARAAAKRSIAQEMASNKEVKDSWLERWRAKRAEAKLGAIA